MARIENVYSVGDGTNAREGEALMARRALPTLMALIFLVAVRGSWIDSPPYVEQAAGLWTEAAWLHEHHFDYGRLVGEEPHVEDGGPRTYVATALPTLTAVLMKICPTPEATFIVYRALCWLSAAYILASVAQIVYSVSGRINAVLSAVAVFLFPIFTTQAEMIGLDMIQSAFIFAWWKAIAKGRDGRAMLWGVLAFLSKPSAFLLPAAGCAYYVLKLLCGERRRGALVASAMYLVANAGLTLVELWGLVAAGNLRGRVVPFQDLVLWRMSCPDLLIVLLAGAFLTILWFTRQYLLNRRDVASAQEQGPFAEWPLVIVGWLFVSLTLLASAVTYYESRHLTAVAPMAIALLLVSLARLTDLRILVSLASMALIAWGAVGNHGRFYEQLPFAANLGWGIPERSLEYRKDHLSNIEAARLLDEIPSSEAVIVMDQFTYFATVPELGYSRIADRRSGYPRYRFAADNANIFQLLRDQPETVVIFHVTSQYGDLPFPAFHFDPAQADEVIFDDRLCPPTVVYRVRVPRDLSEVDRMRVCLDVLTSDATEIDPAARLVLLGEEALARRFVSLERNEPPTSPVVHAEIRRRLSRVREMLGEGRLDLPPPTAKLLSLCERRLKEFSQGDVLEPLSWTDRSLSETLPQRIIYLPPAILEGISPTTRK